MAAFSAALPSNDLSPAPQIRTTDGTIALLNLQAQIESLERYAAQGQLPIRQGAELVDLLSLRGQILGRIADYEGAAARAEHLVGDFAADGVAFLARGRMRALVHRFEEALIDLDAAERLGAAGSVLDAERAAIFQAVGRYAEAMALRRAAVERRETFETLGGLAALHAECGESDAAERRFDESRGRFRGVSPFPLAQLDFQRGHMWQEQGDLRRSRDWFMAAWRRLPAYAPAEGHLAEVEADLGKTEVAIERLRRLAETSDDPDYAAQLARILAKRGRLEEARGWRARAAARYDELVARHLAAYADHAAEFWLEAGDDPHRALWLARRNLEVRRTRRAHELLARATLASDQQ